MDAEMEVYGCRIRSLLERVCACLEGLSGTQLNWRPPMHDANSAYVIAAHTIGCARAFVLGIACGQDVERDRSAEFRASGPDATDLTAQVRRMLDDMDTALAALAPPALDQRRLPPKSLFGEEGELKETSVREVLLDVVEHTCLHLGQLQITRDLALRESQA
ncbi:MAG: DinB family protein [Dehalococcoidia bacterium]|nr:MAG: DinB family protein [Dehalococcoidia bacterium]